MKILSPRGYLIAVFLSFFLMTSFGSCTSQRPRSAWMDVQHARELDKKKGKRSKKYQKNVTRAHRH